MFNMKLEHPIDDWLEELDLSNRDFREMIQDRLAEIIPES